MSGIWILWGSQLHEKVVQREGVLYSLSNRRLFVMRVVANLTRGGITCRVCVLSGDHPRVQEVRYDHRLGKEETKWGRAYSTKNEGLWVHVYSFYRWRQEPPVAFMADYGPVRGLERISEESGEDGRISECSGDDGAVGEGNADPEQGTTDVEQPRVQWQMVFGAEDRVSGADVAMGEGLAMGERGAIPEQGAAMGGGVPMVEGVPMGWVGAMVGDMETEQEAGLDGWRRVGSTQFFDISGLESTAASDQDTLGVLGTSTCGESTWEPSAPSTACSEDDLATPSTASSDQDTDAAGAAGEGSRARRKRWNKMPEGSCDRVNAGTVKEAPGRVHGGAWQVTTLWVHE